MPSQSHFNKYSGFSLYLNIEQQSITRLKLLSSNFNICVFAPILDMLLVFWTSFFCFSLIVVIIRVITRLLLTNYFPLIASCLQIHPFYSQILYQTSHVFSQIELKSAILLVLSGLRSEPDLSSQTGLETGPQSLYSKYLTASKGLFINDVTHLGVGFGRFVTTGQKVLQRGSEKARKGRYVVYEQPLSRSSYVWICTLLKADMHIIVPRLVIVASFLHLALDKVQGL